MSDIDISETVRFHKTQGKAITMTAIQPEARFGNLNIQEDMKVTKFLEKPKSETGWSSGYSLLLNCIYKA